ncbi:hypothetical protein DM02DRAFT_657223 [Periconia macrospinosa]|uniref:Uncharacterized protein n=1 Tax=Periconia macrospinosa TaxID=97972 RepID=A0A2V1DL03_9PLEO|nr:hypothetical protein DM02DRAFT_657223 [Periconia macrospinosa]
MFSVDASTGSARSTLRNSRRRPRNSEGAQQPRRKRSKISDETYVALAEAKANGNGNGSLTMNGGAVESVENSMVLVDMPVREKKTQPKRAPKEDNVMYLNKNENYSVKKLPSFPPNLSSGSIPFNASVLPSANLALAITADEALIWDYSTSLSSAKVLTLPLPPALKGSDPLPLGSIVRNGPANDFGVVAVAPATGRIIFWENVDSAEARGHFAQRHQGVEGSLRLSSGERITKLVDIEYAGYILVLSSGRLAQMTLRDSQGRPSISTTFMDSPNSSSASFFSFKGFLSTNRKTIASVQARPSESKGQMEVITATRNGVFQLWDLSWSGQQIFKRELNVHANVLASIQQGTAPETRGEQSAHILDFSIMRQQQADASLRLLTLVALSGSNTVDYFLLELDVSENNGTVSRAVPLKNFHQAELPKEPTGTLLFPDPGHTAFVQFPTGIVVASLAEPEESPEAQLFADSGSSMLPFQDTIYFRGDSVVRVVGHASQPEARKDKRARALFFIQDFGMMQLEALPPPSSEDDDSRRKVTAFSKILQATFFAKVPGTILDFSTKSRYDFAQADVEKAALRVSSGILSSSFEHFERETSSMEELFRKRSYALRNLIEHLRSEYQPLSFTKKWELLWHAEKLSAAAKLWKWYQAKLREQELHPEAFSEKVLMNDIVKALNEKYKSPPDETETDRVRQFFAKNIDSIGVLIPWGWNYLRMFYMSNESKQRPAIMQRLSEANDVLLTALEAGFSYRHLNCERYGIDPSSLQDGILKPHLGYDALPQIWTSSHNIVTSVRSLIDVGRNLAEDSFEQRIEEDLAQKIAKDNPRLVRMGCQTHIERFQWALDQSDEKTREMGQTLRTEWDTKVRPGHIYGLMSIGLATDGMNLAERYEDMPTLVKLIWDETSYLEVAKMECETKFQEAEISVKLNRIKERVTRYFSEYGRSFAEAYYDKHIIENQAGRLFESDVAENQKLFTKYLASDSSRSKLHWINQVGLGDFDTAGVALYKVAKNYEANAWSKRVELSLSKLALMCKDQADTPPSEQLFPTEFLPARSREEKTVRKIEIVNTSAKNLLEVCKVQELVYESLKPTIIGALDDESAIELLMTEFGQGRLKDRPALQSLLKQGFDELIHHRAMDPALLIDVVTLMTSEGGAEVTNNFILALRGLGLAWEATQRTTRMGLKGLIWKRLLIQDDWEQINSMNEMSHDTLNEFLLSTNLGWVMKEMLEYNSTDTRFDVIWFQAWSELSGKGCTDGELCIRFPSEDLRQPIMRENALDETIFTEYMQKHRLQRWIAACMRAAKWAVNGGVDVEGQEHDADLLPALDGTAETEAEESGKEEAVVIQQSVEVVEVTEESSSAGGDVMMVDS